MASGKSSKAARKARSSVVVSKPKPWGAIVAVILVLLFAGGIFGYAFVQNQNKKERAAAVAQFAPSNSNRDPSRQIPGVTVVGQLARNHVSPAQRVAYDASPPFGGPHDGFWAACNGMVYPTAVRNENMVHSLEHGAVWIAYNPDLIKGAALDKLVAQVSGKPYLMLSPYPALDKPISLQAWAHQLKLDSPDDPRIDQFIRSLQQNQFTTPEIGASCDALGPGQFDPENPPPFNPNPPGPDAVKMDGTGAAGPGGAPVASATPTTRAPAASTTRAPAAPTSRAPAASTTRVPTSTRPSPG